MYFIPHKSPELKQEQLKCHWSRRDAGSAPHSLQYDLSSLHALQCQTSQTDGHHERRHWGQNDSQHQGSRVNMFLPSLSLFIKHDFFTPYSNTLYAVIATKNLFCVFILLYEGWWDWRHCVGEFKRDFSWQRSQKQYYTLRPCGQSSLRFNACAAEHFIV